MPRWTAVRYGWGFQKEGDPSSDTLENMMSDYENTIDKLTAEVAKANLGRVQLETRIGDLEYALNAIYRITQEV